MSKSKPCFEILGKTAFRWHLESWENQIGSIINLNIKKVSNSKKKFYPTPPSNHLPPPPPGNIFWGQWGKVGGGGGREDFFLKFDTFLDIQFKNTSNLIFSGFKVPSKSFFPKNFKTGLTFCHMGFFNFQNFRNL